MNRVGNKGGPMCPFFCCFFINRKCCCLPSSDEEDFFDVETGERRTLLKSKQCRKYYSQKRSKPRDVSKRRNGPLFSCDYSASPIIHSGLKRLPFNGTLSDLTERSEEGSSCALSTATIDEETEETFQFPDTESSLYVPPPENSDRRKPKVQNGTGIISQIGRSRSCDTIEDATKRNA